MGETWYFINSGKCQPAYNMAVDECLLNWHSKGEIPPVIRFYEWEPAGMSVGYFQKTKNKIDLDALKSQNIPLVRRLTGGRAVLHDDELTYSVIVSESYPGMPHSIKDAYRVISKGLLEGFYLLGIDASFATPEGKLETTQSAVCFEEPSWYELVIEGKKAAGSAQTRQKGVILQHGSIPITIDNEKLYDLFIYPNDKVKARARNAFKDKAVSINDVSTKNVTIDDTKTAFQQGFAKGLDINLVTYEFSESQLKEIEELMYSKYMNDSWNLSR
ncbi:lipoate--protein ligase family protein [Gracilibacillus xinjiangensis]|uniref:Biotin/lipoate A/B protein ligase family protein n=1 Tax=Gracilibacillus xinjiangensis TaxID=1193282 RepID=A0ABV8WY21_9BACI